jgi:subtilisin-like proprotein convertase family protein
MRRALAISLVLFALPLAADDFRVDRVLESLTGTYRHSTQLIDGIEVVGGEKLERVHRDGTSDVVYERALKKAPVTIMAATTTAPANATRVYLDVNGEARLAWKTIAYERPLEPFAEYYDAATGALLRRDPLFWTAKGRVFEANPVVKLNDPSLRDQNNAAGAVPDSAYSIVDLDNLAPSGPLAGPYVQIVDAENPRTTAADASQSLMFDRSQPQFEEVNAWFHIDRSLRYIESLGYSGARRLLNYVLPIDAHAANGTDNSYYVSGFRAGEGGLYFGDGGTDDAEDSDIMTHELGHAIQDWIAPGTFTGSSAGQPRALGEGFGDYWAFSTGFEQSILSGRDAFCIADWDARCFGDDSSQTCSYPDGANCLRRVDSTKTMRDYNNADSAGTEHRNGEIWSSALREIFLANVARYGFEQGKRITDTLTIEGTFGVPPNPTYATMAHKLLDADRMLYNGANSAAICTAMQLREILPAGGCDVLPQGELTMFQSAQQGIAIPDLDTTGITTTLTIDDPRTIDSLYVDVDIAHTARGDLELRLISPDGTTVALQHASLDRTANLHATFGLDTLPVDSLDIFRGRSARGTWKLVIADVRPRDQGTLRSWGVMIRFADDQPSAIRPATTRSRQTIAAVAHVTGVNGTTFVTDVRLFNPSPFAAARLTLVFTPSGTDGTTSFGAVKLSVAPLQLVQLSDIVAHLFRTSGTGQLEIQGDDVTATSRTYTERANGTYGQNIGSVSATAQQTTSAGAPPLTISLITVNDDFRTNVGLAEIGGGSGVARFTIHDASGAIADTIDVPVAPFTHVQLPLLHASGNLYATLQTLSGTAVLAGYASVVDNHTGDATYVPGTGAPIANQVSLPAIRATGANGTDWRTDVAIINPGSQPANALARISGGSPIALTIAPGEMRLLHDVIGLAADVGGLHNLVVDSQGKPLIVTSRTWTSNANGSYGQFVAANAPLGESAVVTGVDDNDAFRANIGCTVADGPAVVDVRVFDADDNPRGSGTFVVAGGEPLQIPLRTLTGSPLTNGRVTFETGSVSGLGYAYASVVDNVSSDPSFIPAH